MSLLRDSFTHCSRIHTFTSATNAALSRPRALASCYAMGAAH
jgi:hypothetical protein